MSDQVHLLAQSIFGKSSLEECNLQDIRYLVQRYPYFAPGQFLLLQKLKSVNEEEYTKQLQKAVLYYHNPLAFEYFISSDRFQAAPLVKEVSVSAMTSQPIAETTIPEIIQDEMVPLASAVDLNTEEQQAEKSQETIEMISEEQPLTEDVTTTIQPEAIFDHPETGEAAEMISEEKPLTEDIIVTIQPEASIAKPETGETVVAISEEHHLTEDVTVAIQPEPANSKPEYSISKPETIAFEPFHTVDYFASQGIKLSQEEASQDKFGKQLKSFTEWLKTMKRIPATQVAQLDRTTEKKVEHMAEDSVHEADVVTEAMAEVWLKQGNRQKAIETYNKLSLLNPSKSAYFAALIENLKHS